MPQQIRVNTAIVVDPQILKLQILRTGRKVETAWQGSRHIRDTFGQEQSLFPGGSTEGRSQ